MTLTNRVSLFFLLALGLCLGGYSAAMYLLISEHLLHHFDAQLQAGLNVVVAAIEVESDGVKWQPSDHTIRLGDEREEGEARWIIVDEQGKIVDTSQNLRAPTPHDQPLLAMARDASPRPGIHDDGTWRSLQQTLMCPSPKPPNERDADESAAMTITVARDDRQLHADLWRLKWLAVVLPITLWTMAAVIGRAYCRRALRPVETMSARARSMSGADFTLRLPVSESRDELSELAGAFNSLLDRLQQAFVQQQRFAGDAAHQLRTPLTILRGEVDVALRRPRSVEEHQQILSRLSDQTRELQDIVETLLFLARTETQGPLPDLVPVALSDWLPTALETWRMHPRSADIECHPGSGIFAKVNETLLRQALENLVGNALKYSPTQTPVIVSAERHDGQVVLTVEDHGSGIPAEERSAIFDPFFRSRAARLQGIPGNGLGLAIVARIATALGGQVTYEPAYPHGSRFLLWLPEAAATPALNPHLEPSVRSLA